MKSPELQLLLSAGARRWVFVVAVTDFDRASGS